MLKGKNGAKVVKKISLSQIQLDMMEPNVCLLSTKLDFVTIFTEFCDAKKLVYDNFRFGPEKTFQRLLFFFCGNLLS